MKYVIILIALIASPAWADDAEQRLRAALKNMDNLSAEFKQTLRDEDAGTAIRDVTAEELVRQDITTRTAVPAGVRGRATLVAKESGVFAGGPAFERALALLDPSSSVEALIAAIYPAWKAIALRPVEAIRKI